MPESLLGYFQLTKFPQQLLSKCGLWCLKKISSEGDVHIIHATQAIGIILYNNSFFNPKRFFFLIYDVALLCNNKRKPNYEMQVTVETQDVNITSWSSSANRLRNVIIWSHYRVKQWHLFSLCSSAKSKLKGIQKFGRRRQSALLVKSFQAFN